jgi:hypothetical protein
VLDAVADDRELVGGVRVTKSEASKPLARKIGRCDRVRLLVGLSQANEASADREDCNSRECKSADLAQ